MTGSGPYLFKTNGSMDFTNVTVEANATLSSDNVFWYTTATVDIENSDIFGDVVQASGANNELQTAAVGGTLSGELTGRFLSEGFTMGLTAAQGSTLDINDFQAGVPEPSSFAFVLLSLACGSRALCRKPRAR